jgi:hypothetical protein
MESSTYVKRLYSKAALEPTQVPEGLDPTWGFVSIKNKCIQIKNKCIQIKE